MNTYGKLILVILFSAIILLGANMVYKKGHAKFYRHETQRLNELTSGKINYDIVFFGSSRTYVHNNPGIIDTITGLSSYNFGVQGGNLLEINLWFRTYLESHEAPELVVLDVPVFAFDIERRPFFNPTIYFPYLDNEVIFNTLSEYKNVKAYKYLPFMQLTESDDYNKVNALKGLLGKTETGSYTYKGFLENGTDTMPSLSNAGSDPEEYKVSESGKKKLHEIIEICRNKKIKLMITYAPEYFSLNSSGNKNFFEYLTGVCRQNDIPFIDYRNSYISSNNSFFANVGHLNKYGSDEYSKALAGDILQLLKY